MTRTNLCFKATNAAARAELRGFIALFLSAFNSAGGSSGSRPRVGRDGPRQEGLLLGKVPVLPRFLPALSAAHSQRRVCFGVRFLFLANWVPQEGAHGPRAQVDVVTL